MTRPRFSIVVPTRNRPETLHGTLRTCLGQSYEDFEIVVSDNFGTSRTREVVEELADPRIQYVRTESPLAMSLNWEFALSKSSGEFLIFLGDDDGLFFHGLKEADEAIRSMGIDVLSGRSAYYTWPGAPTPGYAENTLIIPASIANQVRNARLALDLTLERLVLVSISPGHRWHLPSIYNAFVHRRVVERIRSSNGRVFNSSIPDWYSAFAIASCIDHYGESGTPLHIAGVSKKSNGIAFSNGQTTPIAREFVELNTAQGIPWNSGVPNVPMSVSALAAECVQQVREHVRLETARLTVRPKDLVRAIVRELQNNSFQVPLETWRECIAELEGYCGKHEGLLPWFHRTFADIDRESPPTWTPRSRLPLGIFATHAALDLNQFDVVDIHGAATLAEKLLQRFNGPTQSVPEVRLSSRWMSTTRELAKEAMPAPVVEGVRKIRRQLRAAFDTVEAAVPSSAGSCSAAPSRARRTNPNGTSAPSGRTS